MWEVFDMRTGITVARFTYEGAARVMAYTMGAAYDYALAEVQP